MSTLHKVEEWYWDAVNKISRKVATVEGGKGYPYPLARSIKRLEDLKDKPRGTFHKIVKH